MSSLARVFLVCILKLNNLYKLKSYLLFVDLTLVTKQDIDAHYDVLSQIGNLGLNPDGSPKGFSRPPWSDLETEAMEHFVRQAGRLGLETSYDLVGNLHVFTPHVEGYFMVGSHLDTVRNGGNYDGAAGVVAGFEAMRILQQSDVQFQRGIELIVWRGEESDTRGTPYLGSKAAVGKLDPKLLDKKWNGQTLAEAMYSQRVDPDFIRERKSCFPHGQSYRHGYLELHIEQGRKLEQAQLPIGIVTSIFGNQRYWVELIGQADHSGATPMDDRRDANGAYAAIHLALEKLYEREGSPQNLVWTNTMVNIGNPELDVRLHANTGNTSVPGRAYFRFETRSDSNSLLLAYTTEALAVIQEVAKSRRVKVDVAFDSNTHPLETMDQRLTDSLEQAANSLGYGNMRLPSGGGHDAVTVASVGVPVGMLFIPCRDGISHNPNELADHEDIAKGANVLARTLYELAK